MLALATALTLTALAGTAPNRTPDGLELGQAGDAAITAWLTERGLECTPEPSARRTTVRWDCPSSTTHTTLARLDDGPLHHLSTRRQHADPADARTAYTAAQQRLTAQLGSPKLSVDAPGDAAFARAIAHATSRWTFDDLVVELTVLKDAGGTLTVSERWEVPGVAAKASVRPGVELRSPIANVTVGN